MSNKLAVKIKVQIDQIDELFAVYGDLLEKTRRETPDLVEVAALGSILHSFYSRSFARDLSQLCMLLI